MVLNQGGLRDAQELDIDSVNTGTLDITEANGKYQTVSDSESYYFDDRFGNIAADEQFRMRFRSDTEFHEFILSYLGTFGVASNRRDFEEGRFGAQLRGDGFSDKESTIVITNTAQDNLVVSLTHTGANNEMDLVFENIGTGEVSQWSVRVVTQIGGDELDLTGAIIETS